MRAIARSTIASIALFTPFAGAAPASIQSATEQAIIVHGDPRRLADFIQELTPARGREQLGRFDQPICPRAVGAESQLTTRVVKRIRQVAAASGVPVAASKCMPNLFVVITPEKAKLIEQLSVTDSGMVRGLSKLQLKKMTRVSVPVAAWQIQEDVTSDGFPLREENFGPAGTTVYKGTIPDSRVTHITKPHFLASVVVIDQRVIGGVTTMQLADYAAMRALAPIKEGGDGELPAPSILELFNGRGEPQTKPASVTWWDFAFLKALYGSANNVDASVQRSEMLGRMMKELGSAGGVKG